jgi:PncC family amidohydrolase
MESAPLAELIGRLQDRCLELGLKVATAESCTGGLIAKQITDVPGSSEYFPGGVVSYSDAAKTELLDVSKDLLTAHGAVSAQVARAMALGALARFGADLAVSVTGVAGPGGGSPSKPVGLTYVGVADARGTDVRRFLWSGDRAANREASARAAIEMLLARVEETAAAAALGGASGGAGPSGGASGGSEASRP